MEQFVTFIKGVVWVGSMAILAGLAIMVGEFLAKKIKKGPYKNGNSL